MTNEPPRAEDFRTHLRAELAAAERSGLKELEIRAGDFHHRVGGYPGPDHRMATCSDVMRDEMKAGDVVVSSPPKERGASLTIRYQLPRSH